MTELLFEMFTTLTGQTDIPGAITAFLFLSGAPVTEATILTQYGDSYDAIRGRAPQLATIMDDYLAAHGGLAWDPTTNAYNFSAAQRQALATPIEDINSTRRYCTDPEINIQQALTNIARLFRAWGTSSGEIAAVQALIAAARERMRPTKGKKLASK